MAAMTPIRIGCPGCGQELVIDATATPGETRTVMHVALLEESMRQALDHIRAHGDAPSVVVEEIAIWDSTALGGAL